MDMLIIMIFFSAVIFYLLPSVISAVRSTDHQGAIFFINVLFGWTVLGWIAALIWAVVEKPFVSVSK